MDARPRHSTDPAPSPTQVATGPFRSDPRLRPTGDFRTLGVVSTVGRASLDSQGGVWLGAVCSKSGSDPVFVPGYRVLWTAPADSVSAVLARPPVDDEV